MVLHISTYHLSGGAAVAAIRTHRALVRQGISSGFLADRVSGMETGVTRADDTGMAAIGHWARFIGERLYFLPYEKNSKVRYAFSPAAVGFDISRHPLVRKAAVIHLHWVNFGYVSLHGLEKLLQLGKPVVWSLHDQWAFTGGCHYSGDCDKFLSHCHQCRFLRKPGEYDLSYRIFNVKERLLRRYPVSFICPSEWLTDLARKAALTKYSAVHTIPYAIDTSLFKPSDKEEIRRELGLPAHRKLILFASANITDPRKGFRYFRDAVNGLDPEEAAVVIFGKSAHQEIPDLKIPYYNLGPISGEEGVVKVYNAVDMMVVPSLEDNLPCTVMEAMSCAVPVVGFDTGGIPDMIDHLVNGYVARERSGQAILEGIRWVFSENRNGSVSLKARAKVLASYTEVKIAEKLNTLYSSLLTHAETIK